MNGSNCVRLAEFCQFKKEIRGSTEYLIVGLDIAKERHHVSCVPICLSEVPSGEVPEPKLP